MRARSEWSDLFREELQRHRVEPGRPSVRKIATDAPCPSTCSLELSLCGEDFARWEVRKSPIVIHVQMREHNLLHIPRAYAQRSQLRPDLLLALDAKDDLPPHKGVQGPASFQKM